MKKRALISVSDKSGIIEFAKDLTDLGYEIISTGGTYKALSEAGVEVISVSDITGFPECLDGRVKTLHPKIHGGILAMRANQEHMNQIRELGIDPIDIVAINLYPFKETISKPNVEFAEAIENIDIGGPTMIRAAAKNYQDVAVIVDPADYAKVVAEVRENGEVSKETKLQLCYKVFEHTSHYDTLISTYLRNQIGLEGYPQVLTLTYEKQQDLRYGENPHQSAVFYREFGKLDGSLCSAKQLNGKELSFNNINDANGALDLLREFDETAVIAVKHANPCGVGTGENVYTAYMRAYKADPVSIYGGIVATNAEVDKKTALEMVKIFLEIVIAPSFTDEALEILKSKPNLRVMQLDSIKAKISAKTNDMKKVVGGLLIQNIDNQLLNMNELHCVTEKQPTKEEMEDLLFAWKVVKHTKSNAIVLAKSQQTTGVGPGQTNRITALELAVKYAGDNAKGSVMASDAYFPFNDCVKAAHEAGITAIIQPGGSIRDQESIDACNEYGIAMMFTNMRHFKH